MYDFEEVTELDAKGILQALRICSTNGACGTCPAFHLVDQRASHINAVMLEAARHIEDLLKRLEEAERKLEEKA